MTDPFDALRMPGVAARPRPGLRRAGCARGSNARWPCPRGVVTDDRPTIAAPTTRTHSIALPRRRRRPRRDRLVRRRARRAPGRRADRDARRADRPRRAGDRRRAGCTCPTRIPRSASSRPDRSAGVAVTLHLDVADADAATDRARAACRRRRARAVGLPVRRASRPIRDPFGHRWMLNGPLPAPRADARPATSATSPCGSTTSTAPRLLRRRARLDVRRRGADPAPGDRRALPHRITSLEDARSFWPDRVGPTAFCARQVEDLDAAAARIRAAGGRTRPRRHGILDCSTTRACRSRSSTTTSTTRTTSSPT